MLDNECKQVVYSINDHDEIRANFQHIIPETKNGIVVILVPPPGSSVPGEPTWQNTVKCLTKEGYECVGLIPPGKQGHIDSNDSGTFSFDKYSTYLASILEQLLNTGISYENMCISTTSMAVPVVANMMQETGYEGHLLLGAPISNLGQVFGAQKEVFNNASDEILLTGYANNSGLILDKGSVMEEITGQKRSNCGIATILKCIKEKSRLGIYGNKGDVYLNGTERVMLEILQCELTNTNLLRFQNTVHGDPFNHKFAKNEEETDAPDFTLKFLEMIKIKSVF